MRRVAASLAAVLLGALLTACGGGGAEPGASMDATLVLDFQPNAVHSGIYSAQRRGYYRDEGVNLRVREPSDSTDAPKLLRAGRTQFAILDFHDLLLAREKGFDLVGVLPIVQRPLAAVIARAQAAKRPRDLEGKRAGVTGLPSDDAVLHSVVSGDGGDPSKVKRTTIGFNAVSALAAGKVNAATAFWNAEGIALRRQGVKTREFRVDDYGAPKYPELILVTTDALLHAKTSLVRAVARATARGYRSTTGDPKASLEDLLRSTSGLDKDEQRAQLHALLTAKAFQPVGTFSQRVLIEGVKWDLMHAILKQPIAVSQAFRAAG